MNNSAGQGGDALYGKILGFYPQTRNDTVNCSSLFDEIFCSVADEDYVHCSVLFTQVSSITPNTLIQFVYASAVMVHLSVTYLA